MSILKNILANHQEKVKARNNQCDQLIAEIDTALSSVNPRGMSPVAYREWAKANTPTAA